MMSTRAVDPYPVYAVVAADRFLRRDALEGVLSALSDDADSMGPTRVDGKLAELAEVLDELRTGSLLGGRRIVVIEDADAFITAHRASLERYCSSPAEGASLILLCQSLPTNTRLSKIINRTGTVRRPDVPKGRRVIGWLMDRSRETYGKRLSQTTGQMLTEQLGDGMGSLDAELAKLATFVGTRDEITTDDIGALTGRHRSEKVFAVFDAMASGDVSGALEDWRQVWATDRAAPGRAMSGLAWSVRKLLDTRMAWEGGADLRTLARSMYTDASVLQRRLQRVTVEQLEERQRDLLAADADVKTGLTTVDVAIEKFIVRHSMGSPAPAC